MNEASASLNRLKTSAGIATDGIPHHLPHPTASVDAHRAAYLAPLRASHKAPGDPGERFACVDASQSPAAMRGTIQIVTTAALRA